MIEQNSFGKMVISGTTYTFDLKIISGEVVPMWRRRIGHSVETEDVEDILDAKPEHLIIGKGIGGFMKVDKKLKTQLKRLGIELITELTPKAAKTFNKLFSEGKNVAAGFHLTC